MKGLVKRHSTLEHTDHPTAEQVDEEDHEAGDRVAFDKLHRAVHRSVELALALQTGAPRARLLLIDVAVAQIVVDTHLLARHRVERKAGGYFGHAFRTLGNHQKLRNRDDQEHHKADQHFTGNDEFAKGLHDLASVAF